tara:strand:- start:3738 stop:3929 length:192 start_codon:yes stop_codon:yes gene_type:complete
MGLADKALHKVISKKLLVWVLTTTFFCIGIVNSSQWFQITMLWMGGVAAIDLAKQFTKNGETL